MANNADEWEDIPAGGEWEDVPVSDYHAPVDPAKAKIAARVGPPTNAEIAVMRDIPALTSVGYAASEVPVAAPLVERAIKAISPDEYDRLELGKARYEQENPKMSTALGFAAPLALPLGPANLGAQALYQGGTAAADRLLKGGDAGEAAGEGALTAGLTGAMGKAGKVVAPYLRRGGSAFDKMGEKVADYLGSKAAKRAADSVLSGQTALNRQLGESGKENVGKSLIRAGLMDKALGQSPAKLAPRVQAAETAANGEITKLVNDLTEQGVNPSKTQVLNKLEELTANKPKTPDTAAFHNYIEAQKAYIESVPEEEFTLRFLQNRKNEVPYDKLSEAVTKKARKAYSGALQDVQDDVIAGTGRGDEYKGLQSQASGLISAAKGAKERANRFAANRSPSLTDYMTGGVGAVAGSALGSQGGEDPKGGALGGLIGGAALGAVNRYGRSRGSSAMAANINTLSKMFRTKFGPTLEAAAQRGKGAIGMAHYLLYSKNPEYRMLYDSKDGEDQ